MLVNFWSLLFATTLLAVLACGPSFAEEPLKRAPKVENVPVEKLVKAKYLCTPEVRTLVGYTRRVPHIDNGNMLGVFSYSGTAEANWMFLINSKSLETRRFSIPNNDKASHSAALGADGNIYIMPYATNRAYRFDVKAEKFEQINVEAPAGELTWEAIGGKNGCIYFGTYPNACFAEYDPGTGKTAMWQQVVPNTKYVTDFSVDDEGRIRFRAWGPDEVWMLFDPKERTLTKVDAPKPAEESSLPELPQGDTSFIKELKADGQRFAISFPSSRLWEIKADGKLTLCGDPQGPAESWYLEEAQDGLIGISHYGVTFRYDLKNGKFTRSHLPNSAPGGNQIMFVEAVGPDCVIGANYSQQNLFKVDPQTGKTEYAPGMVASVPGEPMCAVGLGGKAYIGIYIHSVLSVYDPKRPFEFAKNPLELADLYEKYQQTRPRDAVTDGRLVFISSDSSYNKLGGALAVIDPETGKVDVYHHLIKDQNLPTLAYDPSTKLLWGGTDRWGQMRSHPPTQPSSLIYAFDPSERKVVTTMTPWPGADEIHVLGASQNGVLVAACGGEIALIDTAEREVLYKGASPIGVPSKLKIGSDGSYYCLANGMMYRWDVKKNVLTPVASAPNCVHFTEASPGKWVLADAVSVYSVELM